MVYPMFMLKKGTMTRPCLDSGGREEKRAFVFMNQAFISGRHPRHCLTGCFWANSCYLFLDWVGGYLFCFMFEAVTAVVYCGTAGCVGCLPWSSFLTAKTTTFYPP